eukprot:3940759-Rhodomonas_salina.2
MPITALQDQLRVDQVPRKGPGTYNRLARYLTLVPLLAGSGGLKGQGGGREEEGAGEGKEGARGERGERERGGEEREREGGGGEGEREGEEGGRSTGTAGATLSSYARAMQCPVLR